MIQPSLFLGLVSNLDAYQDYKQKITSFLTEFKDFKYIIACVPSTENSRFSEEKISLYYTLEKSKTFVLNEIRPYLESCSLETEVADFSSVQGSYEYGRYCKQLLGDAPTIFIILPQDRQFALYCGKLMQKFRKTNTLLVGLGNITHTGFMQQTERSAKDFDSWVRVKLIEFDYYGLRDFEQVLDISVETIFDDIAYYIPFLFIYGTFFGTDEVMDLYKGFDGNTSLRSIAFQHVPLPGDTTMEA